MFIIWIAIVKKSLWKPNFNRKKAKISQKNVWKKKSKLNETFDKNFLKLVKFHFSKKKLVKTLVEFFKSSISLILVHVHSSQFPKSPTTYEWINAFITLINPPHLIFFSSRILPGGFSPKESIYDEPSSTIASELPLKNNEFSLGKESVHLFLYSLIPSPSTLNENLCFLFSFSFVYTCKQHQQFMNINQTWLRQRKL